MALVIKQQRDRYRCFLLSRSIFSDAPGAIFDALVTVTVGLAAAQQLPLPVYCIGGGGFDLIAAAVERSPRLNCSTTTSSCALTSGTLARVDL